MIQIDDAMFTSHRQKLVDLATKYRIPGSYGLREIVDIGGLMRSVRAIRICTDALHWSWTKSSKAISQPICQWKRRPNMN